MTRLEGLFSSNHAEITELAREAGALALGEDGPDGRHWIFSEEQLARFVALWEVRGRELPPLPY